LLLQWLRGRSEEAAKVRSEAQALFERHGSQARIQLRDEMRQKTVTGKAERHLWAVIRELRKFDESDGFDTATRFIKRP
jgi:hypothetical protein